MVGIGIRIGDGVDVGVGVHVGERDEPLLAVEDVVAVLVLHGRGVQVGARAARGLGEAPGREDGLVLELRHELGLELLGAVVVERAPVEVLGEVHVHAHAAGAAGELLLALEDLKLVQAPAAVFLRQRHAVDAVLVAQVVEFLGKLVRDLDFGLHLFARAFDEGAQLLKVRLNSCGVSLPMVSSSASGAAAARRVATAYCPLTRTRLSNEESGRNR